MSDLVQDRLKTIFNMTNFRTVKFRTVTAFGEVTTGCTVQAIQ
jgi:hypothetical protein